MQNIQNRPQSYSRRPTRAVWVGQIAVGGGYPIRVQSMCTSDTKNTTAVISEIEGLVNAGCEIVRVTVPTQADCNNLVNIKSEMKKRGLKVPLVADIHFTPSIAINCVEFVDKVRVNPGNFVDKKKFQILEYTDAQYEEELMRVREKFTPLVLKCKEYGRSIRIGTNHGSLSDRIMNRFGDSPLGMVESALEFMRICQDLDFHDIIFSMKASNVQVMTAAYRLLAERLEKTNSNYPFHLGVTEAGEGEDGRIKSAIGIGALLEDGLGDTIRVSLTEDAVFEVPVAYQLVQKYNKLFLGFKNQFEIKDYSKDVDYKRRPSVEITQGQLISGETHPPRVWHAFGDVETFNNEYQEYLKNREGLDYPLEGLEIKTNDADVVTSIISQLEKFHQKGGFRIKPEIGLFTENPQLQNLYPFSKTTVLVDENFNQNHWKNISEYCLKTRTINDIENFLKLTSKNQNTLYSLEAQESVYHYRKLASLLDKNQIHLRMFKNQYTFLNHAVDFGTCLVDGIGDSVQLDSDLNLVETLSFLYKILQGSRLRTTKAEYISCPSCGRTLFDLQTTTNKIRSVTSHLKGVKIAVMGCIVNGPGEMADADFGYVGTGSKKISLYVGKECVERNIPEEESVPRLIGLIKNHGRWVEPEILN